MAKIPLVGVSDSGRDTAINAHRAINYMPTVSNTGAKENFYFVTAPGYSLHLTTPAIVRGMVVFAGEIYFVAGNKLYKESDTVNSLGTLTTSSGTVQMVVNETQLAIIDGTASIYVWDGTIFYTIDKFSTEVTLTTIANVSGTTYRGTTLVAHGFQIGDSVIITGISNDNFNRQYTITAVAATTFDFVHINSTDPGLSGLLASAYFRQATRVITGVVVATGTTFTVTTSAAHLLGVGDIAVITGTTNFNGSWRVASVPSGTTFTFDRGSTPSNETGLTASLSQTWPLLPTSMTYMDSLGIINNTRNDATRVVVDYDFFVSEPLDFRLWQAINTGSAQREPDALTAVYAFQGDLWLLGASSMEAYYNAGEGGQPFKPTRPSAVPWGCIAVNTVAQVGAGMAFLGRKKNGSATILLTTGYDVVSIATKALEYQLSQYTDAQLATAVAFSYRDDGAEFYVITFDNQTWAYDAANTALAGVPLWHERQQPSGARCLAQHYVFSGGRHIVSHYNLAKLMHMDRGTYTSSGTTIPRTAISGAVHTDASGMVHNSLMLDMKIVTDAVVTLYWSDDGGVTYNSGLSKTILTTTNRVEFFGLGFARNQRVYKVVVASDGAADILTAYVLADACRW